MKTRMIMLKILLQGILVVYNYRGVLMMEIIEEIPEIVSTILYT